MSKSATAAEWRTITVEDRSGTVPVIHFAWTTNTPRPCVGGTSLASLMLADVLTVGVIEASVTGLALAALVTYWRFH